MKFQSVRKTKLLLFSLAIGMLCLVSCSKEEYLSKEGQIKYNPLNKLRGDVPLLELSYELETFSKISTTEEPSSKIDKITQQPSVERQLVQMELSEDGTISLEVEKMTPKSSLKIPDYTLPNNLPEPHRAVVKNGLILIYDKDGEELYSNPLDLPKRPEMANMILESVQEHSVDVVNEAVAGMQSQLFIDGLLEIIANAQELGLTVNEISDEVVSIRMPAATAGLDGFDGEAVHLIDQVRNLLLATRLYDESGELLSSIMIRYADGPTPTLKGIAQEVKDVLPSGMEATMVTTSSIDNLHFVINQ